MLMKTRYQELFEVFTANVEAFIAEVKKKKLGLMATSEWTVKDELCHITFWHENYAANYEALAKHKTPPLPESMSTINMAGVLSLKKCSIKELISRLQKANDSLKESILKHKVPEMTYSKGGRTYKTEYFLEMIVKHIDRHRLQVKRAKVTE
jgi:hypothetical protein